VRSTRLVSVLLVASTITACSGGGDSAGDGVKLQAAGDVKVDVGGAGLTASTTTVPVAEGEEGPAIIRLGSAWTAFRECIRNAGFGNEPLPDSAEGFADLDPAYLDALGKCNNETGIVDAFQAFQAENENLDPDQIEQMNAGLIAFRECIIRRGWEMSELTPNENGALLPSSGPPEPPVGHDSQRDYRDCAKVGTDAAADVAAEQEKKAEENG